MNDAAPPHLLKLLRQQKLVVDWRRLKPVPEVETWERQFLHDNVSWSDSERLEAQALLAKARAKPIEMVEYLCGLAAVAESNIAWIRPELRRIFAVWGRMREFGFYDPDSSFLKQRVKTALEEAVSACKQNSIFHECLAIFLQEDEGIASSLDYLREGLLRGEPVADILFFVVQKSLTRPGDAALIRFVADMPPWMQEKLGPNWPALALKRSTVFASLLAMRPTPVWLRAVDPNSLEQHANFSKTLDDILAEIAVGAKKFAPLIFRRLADVDVLWVSALPGAEEARQKLIEFMFASFDEAMVQKDRLKILLSLYLCLPRTMFFWTNPQRRLEVSRRMLEISGDLPAPYTSMIRARFSLSLGDYEVAAQSFIDYARESPASKGPSSYVDFRSVEQVLAAPSISVSGSWPALTYELLRPGSPSEEPVIIVSANDRYFDLYLEKYIRTLARLSPAGQLHLHLFGAADTTRSLIEKLSELIPNYRISFSYEQITIDQPYFFASGRFLRIEEWSMRFQRPILLTDIDSLWGQNTGGSPLQFLEGKLNGADLGLDLRSRVVVQPLSNSPLPGNRYPSSDPWHTAWAGKVFLRGNAASSYFAKILSRLTDRELQRAAHRNPSANWFIDQNILCAAYAYARRYCPEIKFADLSDHPSGQGQHWLGVLNDTTERPQPI